jgi:hypothetical protein
VDLNREAGVIVDLSLFDVMKHDAPWSDTGQSKDVADEILRIMDRQRQRTGQRHAPQTELLHRRLTPDLSTRQLLDLVDAYFQVGRGVLWRYNLEPLASTRKSEIRTSTEWLGAVYVWRQLTPESRDFVRRSISDVQLAVNWERLRVAYSVDPGLHRALIDTESGGSPIPPEVLLRLPHPDPVFLLPRGVPVVVADGTPGTIRAFFLRGLIGGQYSASTCDEDATHYQVCALTSLDDVNGVPTDWDLSGVSIPLDQPFTVDSASHFSASRWDSRQEEAGGLEQIRDWTRTILRVCLPVVLYCCSIGADMQAVPAAPAASKKKGKRQAAAARPFTRVSNVGYRVGPKLAAARRQQAAADRVASGQPGTRRRTHVRRAHWHTYWYGPREGVREARLKWVNARIINEGDDPATTVIPVQ